MPTWNIHLIQQNEKSIFDEKQKSPHNLGVIFISGAGKGSRTPVISLPARHCLSG